MHSSSDSAAKRGRRLRRWGAPLAAWLMFLGLGGLYGFTLARAPVLGDPTEYTYVAHVLGSAHPPGYALLTLLGKLFQTLVPWGDNAWRMHWLGAAAALTAGACVLGTVRTATSGTGKWGLAAALWGVWTVGAAADFWQHAIHANPHILTAAFLGLQLLTLTRWYAGSDNRWLYVWCLVVGLGVTHHPLTVVALPAEGLFVIGIRPKILLSLRVWLTGAACALLGLLPWLYFPLRSPQWAGSQFPSDLNTLDGFLNLVLARGLRVNLFHFGWADQPDRALVFWSLLRLQYSLPVILLALLGLVWLVRAPYRRPLLWLYVGAGLCLYAFVINTVQDVMAYLLGPFLLVGLLAALGLGGVLQACLARRSGGRLAASLVLVGLTLLGPGLQAARNGPSISLRRDREGADYIQAVLTFFAGAGEGAALLNDWEHMTPLWYARLVEGRWPAAADVRPLFVSADKPWVTHVFEQLPGGPVYLNGFRREIVDAGFRLRPRGPFYQVVEPGDETLPPELREVRDSAESVEILAYSLPAAPVNPGAYVPFILAMRAPQGTPDIYAPELRLGDLTLRFTTDSHLLSNQWLPGEVIVEAFNFALPHTLPAGDYPVTLGWRNLSADRDTGLALSLGRLTVQGRPLGSIPQHLLANFRQRIGLVSAVARLDRRHLAPWSEPLVARVGDSVHLTLEWQSLAPAEESYSVFVHVIDWGNRPIIDNLDYTPLGGTAPTHLWFPKWLPGQRYLDPYRISLTGIPPGQYLIEVGLYEMTGRRRLLLSDPTGNVGGDRYILGPLIVQP